MSNPPRPRAILMRLAVLVTAATFAVFMESGAGAQAKPGQRAEPVQQAPAACTASATPNLLTHPAIGQAAPAEPQAIAARSKSPSSDCSREARVGS